ncbi:MAG: hypothetical protein ACTSQH_05565 [Candidatus Hodarchaeales archaeon]
MSDTKRSLSYIAIVAISICFLMALIAGSMKTQRCDKFCQGMMFIALGCVGVGQLLNDEEGYFQCKTEQGILNRTTFSCYEATGCEPQFSKDRAETSFKKAIKAGSEPSPAFQQAMKAGSPKNWPGLARIYDTSDECIDPCKNAFEAAPAPKCWEDEKTCVTDDN